MTGSSTTIASRLPSHQSGVASGVNNAVTRSAQVLALAILGAVALLSFSNALQARAESLPLSPEQRTTLVSESGKLGETPPPPGLDQGARQQVEAAVQDSFVGMFRLLSLIGAGMALLSAALAWLLVESRPAGAEPAPTTGAP